VLLGGIAWRLDPGLALVSLVAAPALAASALLFGRRLQARTRASREAQARLTSFLHQILGAIPVVQALGLFASNERRFHALAEDAVRATRRETVWKTAFGSVNGFVIALGTAIILYVGGTRVLSGAVTLGSLLVFLGYLGSLQGASQS